MIITTKRLMQFVLGFLVVIGLIGFIQNPVLGILQVDPIHNVVHILLGGGGFYFAGKSQPSLLFYAKVMVVITGFLTVLGFFFMTQDQMLFGHIGWNAADNYFHFALAIVFAYIGFSE